MDAALARAVLTGSLGQAYEVISLAFIAGCEPAEHKV
jgi:hypothetical protein